MLEFLRKFPFHPAKYFQQQIGRELKPTDCDKLGIISFDLDKRGHNLQVI